MDNKKFLLDSIIRTEKDAIEFGFEWPNNEAIIKQAISECNEINQAFKDNESEARIKEEIGDLLHCVISLSIFNNYNLYDIIDLIDKKFRTRIDNLKIVAKNHNLKSLHGQTTEFMLKLWEEAKKLDPK